MYKQVCQHAGGNMKENVDQMVAGAIYAVQLIVEGKGEVRHRAQDEIIDQIYVGKSHTLLVNIASKITEVPKKTEVPYQGVFNKVGPVVENEGTMNGSGREPEPPFRPLWPV